MDNWLATTETGAEWRFRNGILHVKSSRGGEHAFKPFQMRMVDRGSLDPTLSRFEALADIPISFIPVVGLSIYADSMTEWRLSTKVVSVEEIPDEED